MDENTLPATGCGKCHGPLPEPRTKRRLYCTDECKDTAMKRRRRGLPIPDPIPAAEALALTSRLAGVEETLRQTSSALVRARASRDEYKAQVRKLERAVEAARQHADSVAAEQAAKTASLRTESVVVRRQLADAVAVQKELPTAKEAATDAEKAAGYRERLAEGNAAYRQLTAQYNRLWKSFEDHKARTKADARIQNDWDRLCRRLYRATKGRPTTEADKEILTRWINRKNEQHQQKQNQQPRKKAATK